MTARRLCSGVLPARPLELFYSIYLLRGGTVETAKNNCCIKSVRKARLFLPAFFAAILLAVDWARGFLATALG